jgi:TusA-related sulfurtransferase
MPEEAITGADAYYDAGDEGCAGPALGDINRILDALHPGQTLEVRSEDATGRKSFRAYCRLKGHVIEREVAGPDGADRILVRRS